MNRPQIAPVINNGEGVIVNLHGDVCRVEDQKTANFICKAINSHHALVGVLEDLLTVIGEKTKPYALPLECKKRMDSHVKIAEAILAVAKEDRA